MKVRTKKQKHLQFGLTPERDYMVIGLNQIHFRVMNDLGEPVLYPRTSFLIVEKNIPNDWIWRTDSEEEFHADPPETCKPGFYEDLFDGKEYAIKQFLGYLHRIGLKIPDRASLPKDALSIWKSLAE